MTESSNVSVSQFYTNSEVPSVSSEPQTESTFFTDLKEDEVQDFFDVPETARWIKENGLNRVALQFPDCFIKYSHQVCKSLEKLTSVKTFILADTSYRSCCVDEVAAAHANCDSIVHYGDACLSATPSNRILIRYVLGKLPVDMEDCLTKCPISDSFKHVVVVADAPYDHKLDEFVEKLREREDKLDIIKCPAISDRNHVDPSHTICVGRKVPTSLNELEEVLLIFIGAADSSLLPIWLMTFPQCQHVVTYDPQTKLSESNSSTASRQLRKRLFLVEKLKDANTVGLIVGSVDLGGHKEVVSRMRLLCKEAGKKIYVISVGKVNVPKLSNFTTDIDVFVLLSCPFGVLLDCSDYFRPVLSVFEAEAALNPSCSWFAGKGWTTDFLNFVNDSIGEQKEDEVDMSLVTGGVRKTKLVPDDYSSNGQVVLHSAGDYFKQKTWKGLDDDVRLEESTAISDGRKGIAVSYNSEPL